MHLWHAAASMSSPTSPPLRSAAAFAVAAVVDDRGPPPGQYSFGAGAAILLVLCGAALAAWLCALSGMTGPGPALLLSLLCLATVPIGNFWQRSGIFGRVLIAGPTDSPPRIALTFDDGPDPVSTPQVLAALAQHGVRATFFVIGDRAARHPQLLSEMAQAGHQIENHSLHHAWMTAFVPPQRLQRELAQVQALIESHTGRRPRWFRPPIGILSPRIAQAAAALGLRLAGWSHKARDGWSSTQLPDAIARLRRGLRPGSILLLHDAREATGHPDKPGPPTLAVPLLQALLPELKARGLHAVPLDELLQAP